MRGVGICLSMFFCYFGVAQAWSNETVPDPMSDTPTQMIIQKANGLAPGEDTPALVVACIEGHIKILLEFNDFLGSGEVPVEMRWGNLKPDTEYYDTSRDGSSVFFFDGETQDKQIGELSLSILNAYSSAASKAGRGLAARVYPFAGSAVTATFDLSGFSKAYTPIGRACNYPLQP